MKVKDIIKHLSELDGEDELAISWWDRETVEDALGKITDEAWDWFASNWETGSDEIPYTLDEYYYSTGNEWKVQS